MKLFCFSLFPIGKYSTFQWGVSVKMIFSSQDDVCVLYLKTAYFLVEVLLKLASHYIVFVARPEKF